MSGDTRADPQVSAGEVAPSGPSRERMDGPAALTFAQLREANVARCARWHPGFPLDGLWNGADWSNATGGELGELAEAMLNAFTMLALTTAAAGRTANVVKKLRRQETGGRGAVDPDYQVLLDKLADEIADTATYLDLLAHFYGIDLAGAIARKFNAVSVREGLPERLP